jgi:hypothetical protein
MEQLNDKTGNEEQVSFRISREYSFNCVMILDLPIYREITNKVAVESIPSFEVA